MPIIKRKRVLLFKKNSQQVTFHELIYHLKLGYNWLHIWGVMSYEFSAAEGARKLMKPKYIFASPGKTEL